MDRHLELARHSRCKGICRQMLELGHPEVGDGDEMLRRAETVCCVLGLLQQAIHGFHAGVAALVQHSVSRLQDATSEFVQVHSPAFRPPTWAARRLDQRERIMVP